MHLTTRANYRPQSLYGFQNEPSDGAKCFDCLEILYYFSKRHRRCIARPVRPREAPNEFLSLQNVPIKQFKP